MLRMRSTFAGEHRMHGGGAVGDVDLFQDVDAHVVAWIADGGFDEETVHLRFRQLVVPSCSIGFWVAMTMNGCGNGSDAVDGDLLLFHDFE